MAKLEAKLATLMAEIREVNAHLAEFRRKGAPAPDALNSRRAALFDNMTGLISNI